MLDTTSDNIPRFITKKWVEIHMSGSAEGRYKPSKQTRFKTSMLRSDLCDFSDAYIIVKGKLLLVLILGRIIIIILIFLMLFFLIIFFHPEVMLNK